MTVSWASCVVPTQIECDAVQPGDEFGGWPKFLNVQVSPDESLLRQFNGVIFVGNVAKYEAIKPFMVPIDQGIQCPFFASLKRSHQG
jgi:hypothetical protein